MGKLAESLKKHFDETPRDVLDREWEQIKHLNSVGPDAVEYCNRVREMLREAKENGYELDQCKQ